MYFVMTLCRVRSFTLKTLSCSAKALMSIARNCFQQAKTAWCEDLIKEVPVLLSYDHLPGLHCDSRWHYNICIDSAKANALGRWIIPIIRWICLLVLEICIWVCADSQPSSPASIGNS